MKKIIWCLLCMCCFTLTVKAENDISSYRIDITVLENGSIDIVEAFEIDGIYNGFERVITYKDSFSSYYGNLFSSVEDSQLYNGTNVLLKEIRSIDYSKDKTLEELQEFGDVFLKANHAVKGDYGVYVIKERQNSNAYIIYNHSMMNKDFYLNYTIDNIVISHNDVQELALNLFANLAKNINHLDITIHVPNNHETLDIWLHGQNGYQIDKIDNETLHVTIDNILEESKLDFRLVFDKDIITNKKSNIEAYPIILEKENNLAQEFSNHEQSYKTLKEHTYMLVEQAENSKKRDDYNTAYESVQQLKEKDELKTQLLIRLMNLETKVDRRETIIKTVFTGINTLWLLGLFILLYSVYQKFDWSFNSVFKEKYNVNIPKYYPSSLGYLFHKRISDKDLLALIFYMINHKLITFEKTKDDYLLKQTSKTKTELEERVIKFLFNNQKEITLTDISNIAINECDNFIMQYSNFLNKANANSMEQNFYEDLLVPKLIGILYCAIGVIIGIILLDKPTHYSSYLIIVISLITLVYFLLFSKKTKQGKREYVAMKELKNFMIDYSKLSGIDISQVPNYIPYAISLGCTDKFLKQVDIVIANQKKSKKITIVKEYIAFYNKMETFIPRVLKRAYLEKNTNS